MQSNVWGPAEWSGIAQAAGSILGLGVAVGLVRWQMLVQKRDRKESDIRALLLLSEAAFQMALCAELVIRATDENARHVNKLAELKVYVDALSSISLLSIPSFKVGAAMNAVIAKYRSYEEQLPEMKDLGPLASRTGQLKQTVEDFAVCVGQELVARGIDYPMLAYKTAGKVIYAYPTERNR